MAKPASFTPRLLAFPAGEPPQKAAVLMLDLFKVKVQIYLNSHIDSYIAKAICQRQLAQ